MRHEENMHYGRVWKKRHQRGGREGETTLLVWRPGLGMKAQEVIVLQKWQVARRPILDNASNEREVMGRRTLGSLRNQNDDVDNNIKIYILNNGKQYFRTGCRSVFNFSTFCSRSRPIHDVKMTFSSCVDNVTTGLQICNSFHLRTLLPIWLPGRKSTWCKQNDLE